MGLIDFIKGAGEKLFGGVEEEGPSPDEIRALHDRRKAMRLARAVEQNGIEVEDLAVKVSGESVTLSGKVASQADREKVVLVAGNVEGVSAVDDRLEVTHPEPEATYYTVVSGDTLSKIAKNHYGDPMKYPVIFEANRPMLSHPDRIYPGQKLRIPPLES